MANDIVSPPGLGRRIAVIAAGIIAVVGLGVAVKIVGTTPRGPKSGGSGTVLQIWANTGSTVAKMNSSGSLVLSGTLITNHRNTTTSGTILVGGKGFRLCITDAFGTAKEIILSGSYLRPRTPVNGGCTPGDAN